ncbi:MAG: glycosyltransferase [Planctomycetota bacterium]
MEISVVIPTFERSAKLARCLDSLFAVKFPEGRHEILVTDDGSRDDTQAVLERARDESPVPMRCFRQENSGPAAARNLAALQADGERLLFLDDDVRASEELLSWHWRRGQAEGDEILAVLGTIEWCPDLEVTSFMHWLVAGGPQFNYGLIEDPEDVGFELFYTANVSLPRQVFVEAGGFDEGFPAAAGEDTELSYRLRDRLRLIYEPKALVWHDHRIERRPYRKRMVRVGQAAAWIARKHPELAPAIEKRVRGRGAGGLKSGLVSAALCFEVILPNRMRRKLYRSEVKEAFARGYRESGHRR